MPRQNNHSKNGNFLHSAERDFGHLGFNAFAESSDALMGNHSRGFNSVVRLFGMNQRARNVIEAQNGATYPETPITILKGGEMKSLRHSYPDGAEEIINGLLHIGREPIRLGISAEGLFVPDEPDHNGFFRLMYSSIERVLGADVDYINLHLKYPKQDINPRFIVASFDQIGPANAVAESLIGAATIDDVDCAMSSLLYLTSTRIMTPDER